MADQPVRIELGRRNLGVAEIDRDHRDAGVARGCDIGHRVADHDGARDVAAGAFEGAAQNFRVGLLHAERVLPDDRGEAPAHSERIEHAHRQPFELAGADREAAALRFERVERVFQSRKGARAVGDVRRVELDIFREERIERVRRERDAARRERAFEQRSYAGADHRARLRERNRLHVMASQNDVEHVDQVGRGVDQRAVEVEHDCRGGHAAALTRRPIQGKRRLLQPRAAPAMSGPMDSDAYKREAAEGALEFVRPGMRLGLGSGSTAKHFVALLGERVRAGLDVIAVPTSEATRAQAESLGIKLTTLDQTPELDLTIDGADEIGPDLALIKGGGGALLREKIVAAASARMVVIADETKVVATLGAFPLPIEVVPFGLEATRRAVEKALAAPSGAVTLRTGKGGLAFVTDGGHFILDAALRRIADPPLLAARLTAIPGVVEHGLFIGLAQTAVVAGPNGRRVIERA